MNATAVEKNQWDTSQIGVARPLQKTQNESVK